MAVRFACCNRRKLTQTQNAFAGPGCSSFDGALLEVGPVSVQGKGKQATLRDNPGKWNEYANVLFVDQPAGTGYSYINKGTAVRELAPVRAVTPLCMARLLT